MSNYVKSTNFTAKDSLPTGDTNKVIRGSEFDTEFNAIATAVATKSDLASPTFTGTATFAGLTATGTVNFTGGSVTTNIDGGTIDGVTIGGSTPGAGTFSSLVATTADINAGTVDNTVIGGTTPAAGTFTAVAGTTGTFSGAVSGTTGTFSGAVTGSNLSVSNWNTAFGWGNHASAGYLTSVTFSDIDAGAVTTSGETFANSDTQIPTNAAVRNWVLTTYPTIVEQNNLTLNVTWATVPDAYISESSVTQHEAALSISTSQLAGGLSLSDITDVTATATEVNYTDGVTSNIQTQLDSKVGASYTGDVDITGELLVDSYNETFKKVSSVSSINDFDLANASYDSKVFSLGTQINNLYTIGFSSDGTKMYGAGYTGANPTVYQYTLSTAWDVSTASYASISFNASSQIGTDLTIRAIDFSDDGTKMYLGDWANNVLFQYTLSTAWNISTASYDSKSFSFSSQGSDPYGVRVENNGTKLYVILNGTADSVFEYDLSTAYDISTASYSSNSLDVSSKGTSPTGLVFSADGTSLITSERSGTNEVHKWNLSTAWDVSTATFSTTFSVGTQITNACWGVIAGSNGTKLYAIGDGATLKAVWQYTMGNTTYSTTFDCENANVFETELDANTTVVFSNPPSSGTPVVNGYRLGSASYSSVSFSVTSQETSPTGVAFNTNGTKMFVVGATGDDVNEYTLSTGFDVSTATYSQNFSVASQDTSPSGIAFNANGTKMFMVGITSDAVYEYTLSTGFDVSTASYSSTSLSVSTQDTIPTGIKFNTDGTKMFITGALNDSVFEYNLSTGFDLSTATYSQSFSVVSQDSNPHDIAFNADGTKMFISGLINGAVYEYTLSTGFDVSTASYSSISFSVSSQDGSPTGLAFNTDGTKMFIVGNDNDSIFEYSTSSSTLNDSTAYAMSLKVVQDSGASGYTVTWPTSVDWPSATAPTLTATASAVDQFVFYTYDGGTTWYGFTAGQALG